MTYKKLTQDKLDYIAKIEGQRFSVSIESILIGYEIYENEKFVGIIAIIHRQGFLSLDGHNYAKNSSGGFLRAMKKILKDLDALELPVVIMREVERPNLTNIYEKFRFRLDSITGEYYIYIREAQCKS